MTATDANIFSASRLMRWALAVLAIFGVRTAQASSFDPEALKTISVIQVVRLATGRYQAIEFADEEHRRKDLNEIAALDPQVQTLVWLAVLDNGLTEQSEANGFAPASYIGMGRCYAEIRDALADAGLTKQTAAFRAATAGKGRTAAQGGYPGEVELGRAFGTKAEFDDAMLAFAQSKPTAVAWLEKARANLSDDDRLRALLETLWHLDAPDWLTTWPEPYRVLLLADMFDSEVRNGGVHQYFYNFSGDDAPEAVAAMRALGLTRHAETIERGILLFPTPYPTDETERRKAFAHDGFNDWDKQLEALTEVVGYDAVRPAMIAYAKRLDLLPR